MDNKLTSKITTWLRAQLLKETTSGRLCKLELRHLTPGAKYGNEVLSITVPKESADASPQWIENSANEISACAISDSEGLSEGLQRYVILAYRIEKPEVASTRFAFVVDGPDTEQSSGFDSEPPTPTGLTHQLMRHVEAQQRALVALVGSVGTSQARMLDTLRQENEQMREQRMSDFETAETLMSMKQERELEGRKAEAKIKAVEGLVAEVKLLAPAVINRLAKKDIIPLSESNDPQKMAIARLMESLNENQREKFMTFAMSNLDQSQQIALLELFQGANQTDPVSH